MITHKLIGRTTKRPNPLFFCFISCVADNIAVIAMAMKNEFVIPEWETFTEQIDEIYDLCKECKSGTVCIQRL